MQKYIRLKLISIEEIIPNIVHGKDRKKAYITGELVKVSGVRLNTFAKHGTICSNCGLKATHFAFEKCVENDPYHLNLYGMIDGQEVLFTHDHTLARGLGGKDNIDNTTTMCTDCNFKKSIGERILKNKMDKEKQWTNSDQ